MSDRFHDTRWTLVTRSQMTGAEAAEALRQLSAAYYAPVVAFLRQEGRSEPESRDLAHSFFAKVLAGGALVGADPLKGRFRTYLLAALKHFTKDQRVMANALKRGGGVTHQPLGIHAFDTATETAPGLEIPDLQTLTPDAAFDRQWALTVLERSVLRLQEEMTAEGVWAHFSALKPWLMVDGSEPPQSVAAEILGLSPEATKMAVHRLRRRFRHTVQDEVSHTLTSAEAVADELESLMAALRPVS